MRPSARRLRQLGLLLMLVGAAALGWAALTFTWQEPFTGVYAHFQQKRLARDYEQRLREYREPREPKGGTQDVHHAQGRLSLGVLARDYRLVSKHGEPIGRIAIPRLGIHRTVINGTTRDDLRTGPGRDLRSSMPGEGRLVYVAAHRTTYGAPFRHIDDLEPGDRISLDVPYGSFRYIVTGHAVVFPDEIDRLRPRGREELAIQASHPPYSARQRYIVYARFASVVRPKR